MATIQNNSANRFVDIALIAGQDYGLVNNDLQMITGGGSVGASLIRRLLVKKGSWDSDRTFGGLLWEMLKEKGAKQITQEELLDLTQKAAEPMISEGRLKSVDNVTINSFSSKGLEIGIEVTINNEPISTNLTFIIPT